MREAEKLRPELTPMPEPDTMKKHVCEYRCVCIYLCMYIYIYIYIYIFVCLFICLFILLVYTHTYTYIYIYIYTDVYAHACMYVYTITPHKQIRCLPTFLDFVVETKPTPTTPWSPLNSEFQELTSQRKSQLIRE